MTTPTTTSDTQADPVRAAFETRIRQISTGAVSLDRADDGRYLDASIEQRWQGWEMAHCLQKPAPVGEAQLMPGTDEHTMVCFKASVVAPGSRIYLEPPMRWNTPDARDSGEILLEALAVFNQMLCHDPERRFGNYENGDGETIGPRMDALHARLRHYLTAREPIPISGQHGAAVSDAARWHAVEHGGGELTLRIHNTQPGLRAPLVDAEIARKQHALNQEAPVCP